MVFDFCSIEQVEPDVAKIQRVPENQLDFARERHPFCSDGTISSNIVSKLSVEACDQRQSLTKPGGSENYLRESRNGRMTDGI